MRGLVFTITALATIAATCARREEINAPIATVSVIAEQPEIEAGAPLDLRYRFESVAGAPVLTGDYVVFVHMVSEAGALLWTDDHRPPLPVSRWRSSLVYRRTMFVPRTAPPGPVRIEVGIYSPASGARLRLQNTATQDRSYPVATIEVRPPSSGSLVVPGDGWYEAERADHDATGSWRWSKGDAHLSLRNPGGDVMLALELDQPVAEVGSQRVELRVGSEPIGTITIHPGMRQVYRVALPAARFTGGDVDLALAVRPTFVPAEIPALRSQDVRELGVRLFNIGLSKP